MNNRFVDMSELQDKLGKLKKKEKEKGIYNYQYYYIYTSCFIFNTYSI